MPDVFNIIGIILCFFPPSLYPHPLWELAPQRPLEQKKNFFLCPWLRWLKCPLSLLISASVKMPYGCGPRWRREYLRAIYLFNRCLFSSCAGFFYPLPPKRTEVIMIVIQTSFSKWFVFPNITCFPSLVFTSSRPVSTCLCMWLPGSVLPLTKMGKKMQSEGHNILNRFSFWLAQCYHNTAKISIPSALHSVGCEPNQKHSGKIILTTK